MHLAKPRVLAASRPVKPIIIAAADMIVAAIAPVAALAARRGHFDDLDTYLTYWCASVICSGVCFFAFRIARGIWRYFSWRDLFLLALSVTTAVGSASFVSFTIDRMGPVSRTEPILHALILFAGLVLVRMIARQVERSKNLSRQSFKPGETSIRQTLVIGTSSLAEVYLRLAEEMATFASAPVDVVGVVAEKARHVGRTIRGREIVGTVAEVKGVLERLSVHGVAVDTVVVAADERFLSPEALDELDQLESNGVRIIHLHKLFGEPALQAVAAQELIEFQDTSELGTWPGKRFADVAIALTMLIFLFPFCALLCAIVFLDVGNPIIFWQIRPGFRAVATRFYKFRTMRHAYNDGVAIPDDLRVSAVGRFVRRTRLDELPQLVNILFGQMSIVGPRPLLPRDLHEDGADRVRMRPGVTGWAQVIGGKLLNARDKMALDLWYGHHASFGLDALILWRTVLAVCRGDRVDAAAIEEARRFISISAGAERPRPAEQTRYDVADANLAFAQASPSPRRHERV